MLCFHLLIALRYVDDIDSVDDVDANDAPLLMCLVEQLRGGMGADERVNIGMIAICPSTGDVVWDEFEGELLFGHLFSSGLLSCLQMATCGQSWRCVFLLRHVLAVHIPFSVEDGTLQACGATVG